MSSKTQYFMISFWTELIDNEYVNVSSYSPLSGSSYIELPHKLRKKQKRFDQCWFPLCYIRHFELSSSCIRQTN